VPELALLLQHIGIVDIAAVSVGHALDHCSSPLLFPADSVGSHGVVQPLTRACNVCVRSPLGVQLAEKGESAEQVCLREARRIVASVQEYTPLHGSPGGVPLCRCGFV
jgi:hypothetical protein